MYDEPEKSTISSEDQKAICLALDKKIRKDMNDRGVQNITMSRFRKEVTLVVQEFKKLATAAVVCVCIYLF